MSLHDEKVELLRKVDIFSSLREYELDIIARHSEMVEFYKGDVIFSQNSAADEMFVVRSGRVGIIGIDSPDGLMIAQIAADESFGEFDFLGKTPHSALAMTEENSLVLRFPAKRYNAADIFKDHPYISANMLYRLLGIISERIVNVNDLLNGKEQWIHDLKKQLLCDKLTGLYNQTYLKEDFISFLPSAGGNIALLMIKPDNFKEMNDTYGHRAGDQILNLMAIFLQSELAEGDIGIRYKGDEFAAVLLNTDKDSAIVRAKGIISAFRTMDLSGIIGSDKVSIKVSIGIALYPEHSSDSVTLVEIAYSKMFRARKAGGLRIVI